MALPNLERAQPAAQPPVSLIISVYKRPDFLEKILRSCLTQTLKDFEIVIADDGSGPDIRAIIEKYQHRFRYPVVHARHADDGFRKTIIINKAVSESHGSYLVFIDGDCILHHRFIERHFKHRKRREVLSGRRVTLSQQKSAVVTNDDIIAGRFERPGFWWNDCPGRDRRHGIYIPGSFLIENMFNRQYWTFGSNFSMNKDDFLSINGYDENLTGRGLEDINLSQRIKLGGMHVRTITREALQYHLWHDAGPIPHDQATFERFAHPTAAWAENGISK